MTSEQEALLANVAANPDDDLARLVYADWLEERGGVAEVARAKFIRLQIARAQEGLTAEPSQIEIDLLRRSRPMYHDWHQDWHRSINFDRGFPYEFGCYCPHDVITRIGHILSPQNIALRTIRSMRVESASMCDQEIGRTAAAFQTLTNTSRVNRLEVKGKVGGSELFWHTSTWTSVNNLVLNNYLGGLRLAHESGTGLGRTVNRIKCSGYMIDVRGLPILSKSNLPNLSDLSITDWHDNAADHWNLPAFGKLTRLQLATPSSVGIPPTIAQFDTFGRLTEISLKQVTCDYQSLTQSLLHSTHGKRRLLSVTRYLPLSLHSTQGEPDYFAYELSNSRVFAGLQHLDLSGHPLSASAVRQLIEAAASAGVERIAVDLPESKELKRWLLNCPELDRLTRFQIPRDYRAAGFTHLKARLGNRACHDMTPNYFAAQRRWNPL